MCTVEKRGRVYLLTLTGPDDHRLNPTRLSSILSALAQIRADAPKRGAALVIAAEGKYFSNGFDLAWARQSPADRPRLMGSAFIEVVAALTSLPMPTIAAVTGHASAAGFGLVLAHDYIAMRNDRGFLYMSELDLGLPMPEFFVGIIRSKIKHPKALKRTVLVAAKLTAAEAVEMGIVDVACGSAAETVEAAVRMGEELAAREWDGEVYASIRMTVFSDLAKAVGLGVGTGSNPEKMNKAFGPISSSKL